MRTPRPKKPVPVHRARLFLGLLAICVLIGSYAAYRYWSDQQNYTAGHQAYQQADCATAIGAFDQVISQPIFNGIGEFAARAEREKAECTRFQAAVEQQASAPGAALVAYHRIISDYPTSPLGDAARKRATLLFEEVGAAGLASHESCAQLDALRTSDLVPQPDTNLPPLYHACGQLAEQQQEYASAIKLYERFLDDYPADPLAEEVLAALAGAILANAREGGEIPPPTLSGTTSAGTTVITIRNDSPERLRIVFRGPEVRIEELEACALCRRYLHIAPSSCPELGPIGEYTLPPGDYDVGVEAISGDDVKTFKGRWSLSNGGTYASCFFIVEIRR